MIEIVYSHLFAKDLTEIVNYLRNEVSDNVADKIRDDIFDAIEGLSENPESCPPEPRLAHLGNYRLLRLKKANFKIFYRFTGTQIRIMRIFHGKRDFDRIFKRYKF
jgi:plasmid stabilization system protein ParE